jgi:cyclophilin family peptidyl-prolyl cis-trans isomerase
MKNITILFLFLLLLVGVNAQDKKHTNTTNKDKKTIAVIKTNMGNIELELFAKETPKTVDNFVQLAKKGYYKGVIFHRIIDGFMIQGGDPTGTGMGGHSAWGGKFDDEIVPSLVFDKAGILAMANSGPNTNGSQFFITLAPQSHLNGHYSIFGKVIKGMDVVSAIGKVKTKAGDKPVNDVKMKEVVIEYR